MPSIESTTTIMVVEDESVVATDLERSLKQLGYQLLPSAASSDEALLIASERCPDLVLMDIGIRGEQDGIDTAALLRRQHRVPVVYITAYADEETLSRAKETEPLGYLLKPFKPRELRATVEMALYRHQMETRLHEREAWLNTLLRSIGEGVIATDASGAVSFMNPVAEALLGRTQDEVSGHPIDQVMHLRSVLDKSRMENPLTTALRERKAVSTCADALLLTADGAEYAVNDNAAPIFDQGRLLGAVMVIRDVTEERRFKRQMAADNHLVSLGIMTAKVGHEINNPLGVIAFNLDFLLTRLSAEVPSARQSQFGQLPCLTRRELQQVLSETRDAAQRIREIAMSLRTAARPAESGPQTAEVSRALTWALSTTAAELRHRARVVYTIEDVPPLALSETKLGQVLVNIILNAAHAIEPGNFERNEVRISVTACGPNSAAIEVRDTGHGIPEGLMSKVFDPFFSTKAVGRGTGLGLSVCQDIINNCGGSIEVKSKQGEGTTFRLLLPVAKFSAEQQTPSSAPAFQPLTVLLVDDNELVARALARVLSPHHNVIGVAGVSEAIGLFEQGQTFDVVVCDVMMPERTAVDLYRYLKKTAPALAERVLFVTGGAGTAELQEFLDGFPGRVLEKPFDLDELERAIGDVLVSSRHVHLAAPPMPRV
jgi:two-component system, cell cycle sensor histidine kinase and response regulator CckA